MIQLAIENYTLSTALGLGRAAQWQALANASSGLSPCRAEIADLVTWAGEVSACADSALPSTLAHWECRNNRLAELGLIQDGFTASVDAAKAEYGADRVGLFLGTSTSGIAATEAAYAQAQDGRLPDWFSFEHSHEYFSVGGYVRARLGLTGPAMVISTACSSSAKVFASAARAIAAGVCDAAVVGGVDSLCKTTLYGFNSLQLVSVDPCRPSDTSRNGISIGEAAGFALVRPVRPDDDKPAVLGWGESSDAYHMASPDPEGGGAELAMQRALTAAGLCAADIGYINLHGTATPANDLAEGRAVVKVFGRDTPASSTKGWTGHTLGAAGIVEAAIGWLAIEHSWLPQSLNTLHKDAQIEANILLQPEKRRVQAVLSNSFGFGGSNCSLVLGRTQ